MVCINNAKINFLLCQKKVIFFVFFLLFGIIFSYTILVISHKDTQMKRFSSSKDTGAPCQRCMILRIFLGMVLLVLIIGLSGGQELSYLKYVTTQKVANGIMILGVVIFIFKLIFWYWDKKRENLSD